MAEQALHQPESVKAEQTAVAAQRRGPVSARLSAAVGNQARLRRLSSAPRQWQARLEIGAVDDPLEREADAAADAVLRAPAPDAAHEAPHRCPACEATLRRAPDPSAAASGPAAPAIVHAALAAPGQPLENAARVAMETGFGADFSSVRIHTDGLAAESAKAVGAEAYTLGADIVFGAGRYQPDSPTGRRLIAHELAHTLQQNGSGEATIRRAITTPSAGDAAEVAGYINDFCANTAVASGSNVTVASGKCLANTGPGCECACAAMQDATRTYTISPLPCDLKMTSETMFDGSTQTIPESSVWPNTSGPPCANSVQIKIPKAGSAMEFGAFDAKSSGFWYQTSRILAHELCGHGVACQTYAGGTGNRPQHDSTIDTENAIAAPPARGHFADKRQGESFTNKVGDQSKVAFKLVDGWHFEKP